MIEYSTLLVHFGSDKTEDELKEDVPLGLALVKLIEIVGEAARHISEASKALAPEIPWHKIIGARNHLIHGYFQVDNSIIVKTIATEIPELIEQLLLLRERLNS